MAEKGIGCVAIKNIKKGSLVIRERPQLFVSDEEILRDPNIPILQKFLQIAESVINCFLEMPQEEQKEYMKLHNCYDGENWSQTSQRKRHSKSGASTRQMDSGKEFL